MIRRISGHFAAFSLEVCEVDMVQNDELKRNVQW